MRFHRRDVNAEKLNDLQRAHDKIWRSPEGQQVLADLALMWGAFNAERIPGTRPEFRQAFYWILDRWGVSHVDNLDNIIAALSAIPGVRVEPIKPDGEEFRLDDDESLEERWRTPPAVG